MKKSQLLEWCMDDDCLRAAGLYNDCIGILNDKDAHEMIVLIRNRHKNARIIPGTPHMTALEALASQAVQYGFKVLTAIPYIIFE